MKAALSGHYGGVQSDLFWKRFAQQARIETEIAF